MTLQRCAHFKPLAAALVATALTMAASTTSTAAQTSMTTPIKHLVVLFQENISFDHYFGTYPNVMAQPGEPAVLLRLPRVRARRTSTA